MVKFTVWGTGVRGRTAAKILGIDRVVAFIDSNPEKRGTTFWGKPVIQYSDYKKEYSDYAVLNSLAAEKTVTDILRQDGEFFFIYNECPPELMGYGWRHAEKYIDKPQVQEKKIAIYGHTLYSILAYEFFMNCGYESISLIHNTPLTEQESRSFHKMFPFIREKRIDDLDDDTIILQSIPQFEGNRKLYERKVKNIYDWKDDIPQYYNHRIAQLNNKYKQKRCFIVATGPSLSFADLEKLNDNREFCISLNTIFCSFNQTAWRPNQYVVVDIDIILNYDNEIRKMDVVEKFIADASIDFDYESLTDEFYVYHSIYSKYILEHGLVSSDFARYVYNTGTVTSVCLQLAMYEGFSEIYLLGCDCSYFQTGLKHFNEPEEMQIKEYGVMDATEEMLYYHVNSYKKIKEYADRNGIKIYNATRGGFLEVFERVNFDDLF